MTPPPSGGGIVTLLTDFGARDEYAGVMKGVILSLQPRAQVVDLCHEVPPGDIRKAGWLLEWSWRFFPAGTVHVVVVDPGVGSRRRILCCAHRGHLFLCPDNGILSLLLRNVRRPRLHSVSRRRYFLPEISDTFHGRDILAPAAARLLGGLEPGRLGPRVRSLVRLDWPLARRVSGGWEGEVVDTDRFGNAVTNIPAGRLGRSRAGWRVEAGGTEVGPIRRSYASVPQGDPLAAVGSRGFVEVAVSCGSAVERLGLSVGSPVRVRRGRR